MEILLKVSSIEMLLGGRANNIYYMVHCLPLIVEVSSRWCWVDWAWELHSLVYPEWPLSWLSGDCDTVCVLLLRHSSSNNGWKGRANSVLLAMAAAAYLSSPPAKLLFSNASSWLKQYSYSYWEQWSFILHHVLLCGFLISAGLQQTSWIPKKARLSMGAHLIDWLPCLLSFQQNGRNAILCMCLQNK